MQHRIEYTYLDAFGFKGHQVLDGELVPVVVDNIDVRVSISAEHGGIVEALPQKGIDVIGVLRHVFEEKRLELIASPCPTYLPAKRSQLTDLLVCVNEGEC